MLKKLISIAMASIMAMSITAFAASAATNDTAEAGAEVSDSAGADTDSSASGAGKVIYFDSTGWKNVKTIYCHIWQRGGSDFFGWQQKITACKKESDTLYSYDLTKLDSSLNIEGGLKSDVDYCIIFSSDTGAQTYDTTFGTACIGDTITVKDTQIENPKDSEKKGYEANWKTNSSKYGPHLAITSIGNIVGKVLCPNESGIEVVGDWLDTYYASVYCDPLETLTSALTRFGVKDIDAVLAYIESKESGSDIDTISSMLEKAYKAAYKEDKKVDVKKVSKLKKDIGSGKDIDDIIETPSSNGGTVGGSSNTTGSDNSYSGSSDVSNTGADGQEDTIFFALAGIMLAASGVMFVTRRKRED